MDINSGQVFVTRDVKFVESTLYQQLLKTKPAKFALEPAEQDKDSEFEDKPPKATTQFSNATVQPPEAMQQSPKSKVLAQKATALPLAILPIDDSDEDLTLPPETPQPPMLRRSRRTAANISIAMMIEQGPKTYGAALVTEDAEQWREAIGKEVASKESHEVFTFFEKVTEGASMIGSRWVLGRKLMANGTFDKWKFDLLAAGISKSLVTTTTSPLQSLIRPRFGLHSDWERTTILRLPYSTFRLHSSAAICIIPSICASQMAIGPIHMAAPDPL